MAKIEDTNFFIHNDHLIKRQSLKKNENTGNAKKSGLKKSFLSQLFTGENESVQSEEEVRSEEIGQLLKEIGSLGEKLKKSRNLEDLDDYKRTVQRYIRYSLDISYQTDRVAKWNPFKKEKITKIHLDIIDKEMAELTKVFLSEQTQVIDIASKIDKIQGLLIDLNS